jgi:hypothetical protein
VRFIAIPSRLTAWVVELKRQFDIAVAKQSLHGFWIGSDPDETSREAVVHADYENRIVARDGFVLTFGINESNSVDS